MKKYHLIRRLLIANRGEIAVRIIRTCREMGITPLAVYSDIDHAAVHVRMADEAYAIGATPPSASYLNSATLLDVARRAKVDAIHPGYGFLAEHAGFAASVQKAGFVWIGPPATVIARLGSKTAARQLAKQVRVPITDGTTAPIRSAAELTRVAKRIGFPLLLKAVAGGGGKGMRIVQKMADLHSAHELARGEALNAFGNGDIYVEQYINDPHHIEVQILADHHGHVIHLGERECSLQRRHQKILEETPSPFITAKTRKAICAAAVSIAKAAGYRNAGTVEFLVDDRQRFYFLEVNTRIQVEHPITELVTGLDLVREQIRIAAGEPLSITQAKVRATGHAIECRICAEDPFHNFMPSPGTVTDLVEPQGGGIRVDGGIAAGSLVPMDYDPLLGKLCAWGRTRSDAIERMQRALREYRISGVTTNLFLHAQILRHPDFQRGVYTTHFLDQQRAALLAISAEQTTHALIAAAIAKTLQTAPTATAPTTRSAWILAARQQAVRAAEL